MPFSFSSLRLASLRSLFTTCTSQKFDPNSQLPSSENLKRDVDVILSYAASSGISLLDSDIDILTSSPAKVTKEFLLSYSRIVIAIQPVTAFTLRKFFSSYRQNVRFYVMGGLTLAVIVIFVSLFTFISSAISESIKGEIDLANSKTIILLAHLANQDGTLSDNPKDTSKPFVASTNYSLQDLLADLQQFATSLRAIDGRAQQLRRLAYFLPVNIADPLKAIRLSPDSANLLHGKFELEPKDTPAVNLSRLLPTYQQVRAYAQNLRDAITFWSGGVAASILPVLYAILGVCALSLRRMQVAIRDKTFSDSGSKEHMVVAVIAGMMITLFSGLFTTSGVSLPPLALAFLAGYSSDAFFRLLEGIIGPGTSSASNSPPRTTQIGAAAAGTTQTGASAGTAGTSLAVRS
jgi:hypothetical protein